MNLVFYYIGISFVAVPIYLISETMREKNKMVVVYFCNIILFLIALLFI